jgi:hypothetical protein
MTEDIYFLTGLSRRGEPVNLHSFPPRPHNIVELIELDCEVGTVKYLYQIYKYTSIIPRINHKPFTITSTQEIEKTLEVG